MTMYLSTCVLVSIYLCNYTYAYIHTYIRTENKRRRVSRNSKAKGQNVNEY